MTGLNLVTLDLTVLQGGTYRGVELDLPLRKLLAASVRAWQREGLVKPNQSFGLVVANRAYAGGYHEVWNHPQRLMGFAIGWGPERQRYVFNALRKMRAAAREHCDTKDISVFRDTVESMEGGPDNPVFSWGDFPHAGAVLVGEGDRQLLIGVSGLTATEDDWVARMAAGFLHGLMDRIDKQS